MKIEKLIAPCAYCEMTALLTRDHVVPQAVAKWLRAHGVDMSRWHKTLTRTVVLCCSQCNYILQSRVFRTWEERVNWIRQRRGLEQASIRAGSRPRVEEACFAVSEMYDRVLDHLKRHPPGIAGRLEGMTGRFAAFTGSGLARCAACEVLVPRRELVEHCRSFVDDAHVVAVMES